MNIARLSGLLALLLVLWTAPARATSLGPWHELQLQQGKVAVSFGSQTYGLSVAASPHAQLDDHAWIDLLAPPLSIGKLQREIEKQYGLLNGDLTPAGSCDRRGLNCTAGAQMGTATTRRGHTPSGSTFTSNSPFDYLAVRVGLSELLFHWSAPTHTFTLAGIPSTLVTDYRAFIGPVGLATPLPAAGLLFGSALLGMLGLGRRRKTVPNAG